MKTETFLITVDKVRSNLFAKKNWHLSYVHASVVIQHDIIYQYFIKSLPTKKYPSICQLSDLTKEQMLQIVEQNFVTWYQRELWNEWHNVIIQQRHGACTRSCIL